MTILTWFYCSECLLRSHSWCIRIQVCFVPDNRRCHEPYSNSAPHRVESHSVGSTAGLPGK